MQLKNRLVSGIASAQQLQRATNLLQQKIAPRKSRVLCDVLKFFCAVGWCIKRAHAKNIAAARRKKNLRHLICMTEKTKPTCFTSKMLVILSSLRCYHLLRFVRLKDSKRRLHSLNRWAFLNLVLSFTACCATAFAKGRARIATLVCRSSVIKKLLALPDINMSLKKYCRRNFIKASSSSLNNEFQLTNKLRHRYTLKEKIFLRCPSSGCC